MTTDNLYALLGDMRESIGQLKGDIDGVQKAMLVNERVVNDRWEESKADRAEMRTTIEALQQAIHSRAIVNGNGRIRHLHTAVPIGGGAAGIGVLIFELIKMLNSS